MDAPFTNLRMENPFSSRQRTAPERVLAWNGFRVGSTDAQRDAEEFPPPEAKPGDFFMPPPTSATPTH